MRKRLRVVLGVCLLGWQVAALAVGTIEAQALMPGMAVLRIDGTRHVLHSGQRSPEGVLLVMADAHHAVIEVDGKRRELKLSQRISSTFTSPAVSEVRIDRNDHSQYLTTASINGHLTRAIVDTGANTVALSSAQATALGIDYYGGRPTHVATASGVAKAYAIELDSVAVGSVSAHYVPAMVIEGDFPQVTLLGMSFLQRVGMREQNGALYLRQKY